MYILAQRAQKRSVFRGAVRFLCLILSFSLIVSPLSYAQNIPLLNLPQPGALVPQSPQFVPVLLKGLTINIDNPLQFDFIVDSGNTNAGKEQVKEEAQHLIKYFLASLTIPKDDLWVNLSPYEQDRIIPQELAKTELGRDMLAQDYLLKQLTASFIHPEKDLGKKFWDRVYDQAQKKYGTTDIPINTFNKVWILPEKARVFERGNTAYVVESRLKVMMDEDYQALKHNSVDKERGTARLAESDVKNLSELSSVVMREIVLPEIEKEVNTGKNFAKIRQIYHSLILAKWYKETVKESLLSKVYVDKNKTAGVDVDDKAVKDKIYAQYVDAYKKGVFNLIKEDYDAAAQETIPRKYFSGGITPLMDVTLARTSDPAQIRGAVGDNFRLSVVSAPQRDGANFSIMSPFARISPLHNTAITDALANIARIETVLRQKGIGDDVADIADAVLQEVNRFPVPEGQVPEAAIPEDLKEWLERDGGRASAPYFAAAKDEVANGGLVKFLPWGGQATRAAAILGGGAKSLFSLKNFSDLNLLDEKQFPLRSFDEKDEAKAKQIRQSLVDFQAQVKSQAAAAQNDAFRQYLLGLSLGAHQLINYRVQLEKLARERGVADDQIGAFVRRSGKFIIAVNDLTGEGIVDELAANDFFGFDAANVIFIQQDTLPPLVRVNGKFEVMTDKLAADLGLSAPIRVTYNHGYIANQLKTSGAGFVVDIDAQRKARPRYIEDRSPYQYMIDQGGKTMTNANIDDNPQLTEEVLPLNRLAFAKYLMETKGVKTIAEVLENKSGQKGGSGLKKIGAAGDIIAEGPALKLFDIKGAYLNRMLVFTDIAAQQAVTETPRIHWEKKKIKNAAGQDVVYYIPESYFTDAVTWFVPTLTFYFPGLAINAFKQPWNVVKRDLSSEVPGTGPMMFDLHRDPGFAQVAQRIFERATSLDQRQGAQRTENPYWRNMKARIQAARPVIDTIDEEIIDQLQRPASMFSGWSTTTLTNASGQREEARIFHARVVNNNYRGPGKGGIRWLTASNLLEDPEFVEAFNGLNATNPSQKDVEDFIARWIRQEAQALSLGMTLKNAGLGLKLGGGKAAVFAGKIVERNGKWTIEDYRSWQQMSREDKARIARLHSSAMAKAGVVGIDADIPAPDVNTTPEIMAWYQDEYLRYVVANTDEIQKADPALNLLLQSRLSEYTDENIANTPILDAAVDYWLKNQPKSVPWLGVYTGKTPDKGGALGRAEATGEGVVDVMKVIFGEGLRGQSVAIQGFGNVGTFLALRLLREGARVKVINDISGTFIKDAGFSEEDIQKLIASRKTIHQAIVDGAISAEGIVEVNTNLETQTAAVLEADVDILIPAARENQITEKNAGNIKAKWVIEAANGPTTPAAERTLYQRGIRVVPDTLANAGGVGVSSLETEQVVEGRRLTPQEVSGRRQSMLEASTQRILTVLAQNPRMTFREAFDVVAIQNVREAKVAKGLRLADANFSSMNQVVDDLLKPVQELRRIRSRERESGLDPRTEAIVSLAAIQTDEAAATINALMTQAKRRLDAERTVLSHKALAVLAWTAARFGKSAESIILDFTQVGRAFAQARISISYESQAYYTAAVNQPGQDPQSILRLRQQIEQWAEPAPQFQTITEEAIAIFTLAAVMPGQTPIGVMNKAVEVKDFLDQIERSTSDETGAFLTMTALLSEEKNLQRVMSQVFKLDTGFMANSEELSDEALAIYGLASTQLKPTGNRSTLSSVVPDNLGGIDLNEIDLQLEGEGVSIQFSPTQMQNILLNGIDGLAPVIINIVPITNILPILGLEPQEARDIELSSIK